MNKALFLALVACLGSLPLLAQDLEPVGTGVNLGRPIRSSTELAYRNRVDFSRPVDSIAKNLSPAASAAAGGRTIKIVAIGDSITHGGRTDAGHEDEWTYRLPLQRMLLEKKIPFDFVGSRTKGLHLDAVWPDPIPGIPFDPDHEAQYGAKTAVARDYLRKSLPQIEPPDIALIHLGTNNKGDPQNHGIGHAEAIVEPLRQIIGMLRERNPNIVILLGHLNFDDGNALLIRPLVEALAVEEHTLRSPVVTVHHYLGFNADPNHPDSDTYDWAHPNPSGQEKMAQHWFNALLPYLNISDAIAITTSSFPGALAGQSCSQTMVTAKGINSLGWSISSGSSLPSGLAMSTAGVIAGAPGANTSLFSPISVVFTLVDSSDPVHSDTRNFSLPVSAPVAVPSS